MKKIAVIATLVVGIVIGCVIMTIAPDVIGQADAAPVTPEMCVCSDYEGEALLHHCYCGELECAVSIRFGDNGFTSVSCK
jgi:hypothetical protein